MSTTVNIHGKEYTLASEAKTRFSYTKDYLLMLAKEGKIDGVKIQSRWYLFIPSIETFLKESQRSKEERKAEIRLERRRELTHFQKSQSVTLPKSSALLQTCVIAGIGIFVGTFSYVSVTTSYSFADMARAVYLSFNSTDTSMHAQVFSASIEASSSTIATEISSRHNEGIVILPASDMDGEDVARIQESFSDPVTVVFDEGNQNAGVVTPLFSESEESYRFIMVPDVESRKASP